MHIKVHPGEVFVELHQALLIFISESEVCSRVAFFLLTNVSDLLIDGLDLLLIPACSAAIAFLLSLSSVQLTGKFMLGEVEF